MKTRKRPLPHSVRSPGLWWLLCALAISAPVAAWAEAAADAAASNSQQLEQRLRDAQHALEKAAGRLAALQRQKHGHMQAPRKAMLGILIDDKGDNGGLTMTGLTPGGGAAEAGLQAGDRIVEVNGTTLAEPGQTPLERLSSIMADVKAGDVVQVRFERGEQSRLVDLTTRSHELDMKALMAEVEDKLNVSLDLEGLGEGIAEAAEQVALGALALESRFAKFGASMSGAAQMPAQPYLIDLDAQLGSYFGVDQGVLVASVPAGETALRSGDVLLELAGKPVLTARQALAQLAQAGEKKVPAALRRKGERLSVVIDSGSFCRDAP